MAIVTDIDPEKDGLRKNGKLVKPDGLFSVDTKEEDNPKTIYSHDRNLEKGDGKLNLRSIHTEDEIGANEADKAKAIADLKQQQQELRDSYADLYKSSEEIRQSEERAEARSKLIPSDPDTQARTKEREAVVGKAEKAMERLNSADSELQATLTSLSMIRAATGAKDDVLNAISDIGSQIAEIQGKKNELSAALSNARMGYPHNLAVLIASINKLTQDVCNKIDHAIAEAGEAADEEKQQSESYKGDMIEATARAEAAYSEQSKAYMQQYFGNRYSEATPEGRELRQQMLRGWEGDINDPKAFNEMLQGAQTVLNERRVFKQEMEKTPEGRKVLEEEAKAATIMNQKRVGDIAHDYNAVSRLPADASMDERQGAMRAQEKARTTIKGAEAKGVEVLQKGGEASYAGSAFARDGQQEVRGEMDALGKLMVSDPEFKPFNTASAIQYLYNEERVKQWEKRVQDTIPGFSLTKGVDRQTAFARSLTVTNEDVAKIKEKQKNGEKLTDDDKTTLAASSLRDLTEEEGVQRVAEIGPRAYAHEIMDNIRKNYPDTYKEIAGKEGEALLNDPAKLERLLDKAKSEAPRLFIRDLDPIMKSDLSKDEKMQKFRDHAELMAKSPERIQEFAKIIQEEKKLHPEKYQHISQTMIDKLNQGDKNVFIDLKATYFYNTLEKEPDKLFERQGETIRNVYQTYQMEKAESRGGEKVTYYMMEDGKSAYMRLPGNGNQVSVAIKPGTEYLIEDPVLGNRTVTVAKIDENGKPVLQSVKAQEKVETDAQGNSTLVHVDGTRQSISPEAAKEMVPAQTPVPAPAPTANDLMIKSIGGMSIAPASKMPAMGGMSSKPPPKVVSFTGPMVSANPEDDKVISAPVAANDDTPDKKAKAAADGILAKVNVIGQADKKDERTVANDKPVEKQAQEAAVGAKGKATDPKDDKKGQVAVAAAATPAASPAAGAAAARA